MFFPAVNRSKPNLNALNRLSILENEYYGVFAKSSRDKVFKAIAVILMAK